MRKNIRDRSESTEPILRREKASPCEDFWHTITLGVPIALLLYVVLPPIFHVIRRLF